MPHDAFISYSLKDKVFATRLEKAAPASDCARKGCRTGAHRDATRNTRETPPYP